MGDRSTLGRPPLTERRKAETRLEIARAAVRLFTTRGVAATSVEDIAAAAGISVRTFWRYATGKEDSVQPLLTAGIDLLAGVLSEWRPGEDITAAFDEAARATVAEVPTMVALVRLAQEESGLRAVWLRAHNDAELVFADTIARSTGRAAGDLQARVLAAIVNGAVRAAVEHYAEGGRADWSDLAVVVREALQTAMRAFDTEPGV
ncbi:TetR/AcrR family transcriptional regulator [Amycolatopsis magusensis]|uniref:AcrR family transcriptional regulator n=1 Tax=Amycolatopsis magusensis TaxID=882444 RepID=A0ABS4PXI2_9PSEU|nr:TetR/AcrR family transcriptional regulator [Amycolatopsis magusensis]MBP2184139.1 AcrR family transcriptional regulator [Amycolatopsis magusensis]